MPWFKQVLTCTIISLFAMAFSAWGADPAGGREMPLIVRYPDVPSDPVYFENTQYLVAILRLALDHADVPYFLEAVNVPSMPTSRSFLFLQKGRFNVGWAHTDAEREQGFRPIRIPLYRGLVGWRLFFIREQDAFRYGSVQRAKDLRLFRAGQGHDWPDLEILEQNGFTVRAGLGRDSLFQLLKHGRIDYFPRGVYEILAEQSRLDTQGLLVEESLVLRYPSAYYFFTTKENERLASLIEQGFEKAIDDGEFFRLFMERFGTTIRKVNLENRKVFEISNPTLSTQTPLHRAELWFHPAELKTYNSNRRFAHIPAE